MIFQFRIISDESKDFAREMIIDGEQTFLDFHHVLQENLDYDPAQLASFFLTNQSWEKEKQVTLIDMMDDTGSGCLTMDEVKISELMKETGQRLLYVFDFFSERSFYMELTGIIDKLEGKDLPKIIFAHGNPPEQIELGIENLDSGGGISDDLDYGIGDEDLSEGFEFADGDDFPEE